MKKKLGFISLLLLMTFLMVGCAELETTLSREEDYTETIKQQSLDSVGLPAVDNFFEMGQLKSIYELRDNPNLICHWYTVNQYTGKLIYKGECIGFGIPYGTQITNPETYEYQGATLPQAEPNGLYSTNGTSATWILAVNSKGDIEASYVEQCIEVYQSKRPAYECEEWSLPDNY